MPMLLGTATHHIASLRKGRAADWVEEPKELAGWYDGEIGRIVAGLNGRFPAHLDLEGQGRFAIGYYHQRYRPKDDEPAAAAAADAIDTPADEY